MTTIIQRFPERVPMRWVLLVIIGCFSLLSGAMGLGLYVKSMDDRLAAAEQTIPSIDRLNERLFSIDHRLSLIEGKLEVIEKK